MLAPDHPGDRPVAAGAVIGMARDFPDGFLIAPHRHARAQLVYASSGVMTVETAAGTWVVPPQRAVWLPAGIEHQIRTAGAVRMRTLYLDPALQALPPRCAVIAVTPLLRALVLRLVERPAEALVPALLEELRGSPALALDLPMPLDPRARRVAEALIAEPADPATLDQWGRRTGASARTLARLFQRETGLGFGAWRQRLRLIRSLPLLAAGGSVLAVALELGYDSPSAFAAMFRRALGRAPSDYVADRSLGAEPETP